MVCLFIIMSFYFNSYHDYMLWMLICGPHNILTEQLGLHSRIVSYFRIFVSAFSYVKFNSCFITYHTLHLEHNLQLPGRKMFECQKSHLTLTGADYICSALCPEWHPASIQCLEEWVSDLASSQLDIEFHHSPP